MLPDFEIIQHQFSSNDDITIIPIADVHLGAAEQFEQEWMSFLSMIEKTPNVYLTLGGDMLDTGTKNSVTNVYRNRYMPSEAKRMMAKMLEPVRDRIVCAVCGNHERRSIKEVDSDPMYDIMCRLDIEHLYRENMAFVKIQLGNPKRDGIHNPTYIIVVTHGAGGGLYTGGAVNRGERFGYVIDGMDALIVGHTHKPFDTKPGKIKIDPYNNKVSIKPFRVISVSSWLGYAGYAAAGMMNPTTHCIQKLMLCGSKKEISVLSK